MCLNRYFSTTFELLNIHNCLFSHFSAVIYGKQLIFPDGKTALADDARISKLVRKASRDDDRERRLHAVRQLKDFLVMPENAKVCVWKLSGPCKQSYY